MSTVTFAQDAECPGRPVTRDAEPRRVRRFARATHGLSRLVILGSTGALSLESLEWCEQLGIGVAVLAIDGARLLTSVPRKTDDARLRRIQAQAPDLPVGLDLARSLIVDKLIGQARVLTARLAADDEASQVLQLAEALDSATSMGDSRDRGCGRGSLLAKLVRSFRMRAALCGQGREGDPSALDTL